MGRIKRKASFKFKPFSNKQLKILTWWLANSPVHDRDGIIADGAIRSGKTISMCLSYAMWAMESFNGQNFGMCGKTIGSFRRNVLFWLKLMLVSRGYKVVDQRADNLVIVSRKNVTNYFYVFGGKDERSQDLIQGITLAGCFFDEVALMPESFVNQATGRCSVDGSKFWFNCNPDGPYHWFKVNWIECFFDEVALMPESFVNQATGRCSVDGSKFWFNCNPDGPYHWFKVNWIDKQDEKNLLYLHFTMDDNLSLTEKIKARYRSMYSGVFYDRYIRGLWAIAEGIIYDMFSKEKHIVDVQKLIDCGEITLTGERYVSIDYGTQNPTVFLLWEKANNSFYYCTREYYYSGRENGVQKTDAEYADDLKEWLGNTKVNRIIIDPSAASFIAQLQKNGFKIKKANNSVLDGIRLVATLLNELKLFFDVSCTNTVKEFGSYVWDVKASEHGEDKPVKEHDHAMDAIRYFCMTILKVKTGMRILKPKGGR